MNGCSIYIYIYIYIYDISRLRVKEKTKNSSVIKHSFVLNYKKFSGFKQAEPKVITNGAFLYINGI